MWMPCLLRSAIKIKRMGLAFCVHNSKNIKNMQGDSGEDILTYPEYATQDVAQFLKRIPV